MYDLSFTSKIMRNNGGQMEDTEKKSKNQKSIVANKNDGGEKLPHKIPLDISAYRPQL